MNAELKRVAYHEAGHAVASYVLRVPFASVSIIEDDDSNGRVMNDEQFQRRLVEMVTTVTRWDTRTLKRIDNYIVTLMAGDAAVELLTNKPIKMDDWDLVRGADLRAASDILLSLGVTDQVDEIEKFRLKARVVLMNNWGAIIALASALLESKELSGRKAREIIKGAPSDRLVEVDVEKNTDKPTTVRVTIEK